MYKQLPCINPNGSPIPEGLPSTLNLTKTYKRKTSPYLIFNLNKKEGVVFCALPLHRGKPPIFFSTMGLET